MVVDHLDEFGRNNPDQEPFAPTQVGGVVSLRCELGVVLVIEVLMWFLGDFIRIDLYVRLVLYQD